MGDKTAKTPLMERRPSMDEGCYGDDDGVFGSWEENRVDEWPRDQDTKPDGEGGFGSVWEDEYGADSTGEGAKTEVAQQAEAATESAQQQAKDEARKAVEQVTQAVEGGDAQSMVRMMQAMASMFSASSPYGGMSSVMNRNVKNSRGFFTTEVVMHLQASLEQLAARSDEPNAVTPVLRLEPSFAGFEVPGKANGKRQTQLHAQGRIYLLGARSDFPCSIALQVGSKLRGANEMNVHSGNGVKCAHIIVADDKYSYANNPLLLTHSDVGSLTEQYAKDYSEYLFPSALQSMWKRVPGKTNLMQVKIKSPLFDAINAARTKAAEENSKKSTSDRADNNDFKMLREHGDHESATGFTYAPAIEVAHALKSMEKPLKSKVNYVPLYEALEFPLKRAFARRNESGAKKAKSEWLDPTEVQAKKNRSTWTDEQQQAAFKQVHTLHARLLVEYVPLTISKN